MLNEVVYIAKVLMVGVGGSLLALTSSHAQTYSTNNFACTGSGFKTGLLRSGGETQTNFFNADGKKIGQGKITKSDPLHVYGITVRGQYVLKIPAAATGRWIPLKAGAACALVPKNIIKVTCITQVVNGPSEHKPIAGTNSSGIMISKCQ